jgi:hypothetical protein
MIYILDVGYGDLNHSDLTGPPAHCKLQPMLIGDLVIHNRPLQIIMAV